MHKYQLTTLPVGRRGSPSSPARYSPRRPVSPSQLQQRRSNSASTGENLRGKLNRSNGVIHPKEVDPTIIEKPAPRDGRSERGAAARDFGRRSRATGKMRAAPTTSGPGRPPAAHSGPLAALLPSPALGRSSAYLAPTPNREKVSALGDRFHEFDPPCALIGLISDP